MHLNYYPFEVQAAIRRFSPAVPRWAAAAGVCVDDVQQEIAVATLCGLEPAAAVPAALGLRRLTTGWRSKDPAVVASIAGCVIDESIDVECEQSEPVAADCTGLAVALIGGTAAIAKNCKIGRRMAQIRIKQQLQRFEESGDLFGLGGY